MGDGARIEAGQRSASSGSCSAEGQAGGCQELHTGHGVQQLQWLWPLALSDCGARGRVAGVHRGWMVGAVAVHRLRGSAVHSRIRSRAAHLCVESVHPAPEVLVKCFLFYSCIPFVFTVRS